jgi:hypothetical protein
LEKIVSLPEYKAKKKKEEEDKKVIDQLEKDIVDMWSNFLMENEGIEYDPS